MLENGMTAVGFEAAFEAVASHSKGSSVKVVNI